MLLFEATFDQKCTELANRRELGTEALLHPYIVQVSREICENKLLEFREALWTFLLELLK